VSAEQVAGDGFFVFSSGTKPLAYKPAKDYDKHPTKDFTDTFIAKKKPLTTEIEETSEARLC